MAKDIEKLTKLAEERICLVESDGSKCGLCDERIVSKKAASIKVKLPIVGLQEKHFCPDPCMGIIMWRIQNVYMEMGK